MIPEAMVCHVMETKKSVVPKTRRHKDLSPLPNSFIFRAVVGWVPKLRHLAHLPIACTSGCVWGTLAGIVLFAWGTKLGALADPGRVGAPEKG